MPITSFVIKHCQRKILKLSNDGNLYSKGNMRKLLEVSKSTTQSFETHHKSKKFSKQLHDCTFVLKRGNKLNYTE